MSGPTLAVTGSTGALGGLVARALAEQGVEQRLLVRDPSRAPDLAGARLLGWGEGLGVDTEDALAFLPALRPLFGDAGFQLDAPHPARWYLRLPAGTRLPASRPRRAGP